jgi:hypothetical protein
MMSNPLVVIAKVEGNIGFMEKVMGKILFDGISLIAKTNYEIIEPIMGINFHNMP